jgi:hypothetical protein
MRAALEEPITIRTANGETTVPAVGAMLLRARNRVIEKGNPYELRALLDLCVAYKVLKPEEIERSRGVLVVPPRSASAEEWERDYGGEKLKAYQDRLQAEWDVARPPSVPAPSPEPAPAAAKPAKAVPIDMPRVPDLPGPKEPKVPPPLSESARQLAAIREHLEKSRKQ